MGNPLSKIGQRVQQGVQAFSAKVKEKAQKSGLFGKRTVEIEAAPYPRTSPSDSSSWVRTHNHSKPTPTSPIAGHRPKTTAVGTSPTASSSQGTAPAQTRNLIEILPGLVQAALVSQTPETQEKLEGLKRDLQRYNGELQKAKEKMLTPKGVDKHAASSLMDQVGPTKIKIVTLIAEEIKTQNPSFKKFMDGANTQKQIKAINEISQELEKQLFKSL